MASIQKAPTSITEQAAVFTAAKIQFAMYDSGTSSSSLECALCSVPYAMHISDNRTLIDCEAYPCSSAGAVAIVG